MTPFKDVIHDLGLELDTTLHVDEKGVCCIEINDLIKVQLEPGPNNRSLLICTIVSEIPPGKFREQALLDYLRANDYENQKYGTFSFLPKRNLLFFHHRYSTQGFRADELVEFLTLFAERANAFKEAINKGLSVPYGELEEVQDDDKPHTIETGIKT